MKYQGHALVKRMEHPSVMHTTRFTDKPQGEAIIQLVETTALIVFPSQVAMNPNHFFFPSPTCFQIMQAMLTTVFGTGEEKLDLEAEIYMDGEIRHAVHSLFPSGGEF